MIFYSMRTLHVAFLMALYHNAFSALAQVPQIVEKASKAVVFIKGSNDTATIVGSGFLVSTDGKIATNLHVIRDMKTGGVQLQSGEIFDSFSILAFDERKDLAIVQIAGFDLPIVELGNSNEIKIGELVVAIGSPRGLKGTVTTGVVSSIREESGYKTIQTDAAVNPGNSGGPLLNSEGRVIGVITSKLRESEGLNFAMPVNYIRGLLAAVGKPMSLAELNPALKTTSVAFKVAPVIVFPTNWKSMLSGNRFKLRKDNEIVYVEWVLTEQQRGSGRFTSMELHKDAQGYSGKEHVVIPQSYIDHDFKHWNEKQVVKHCSFDYKVLISTLSDTRIEGHIWIPPDDSKLNPKKCLFDKELVEREFVWIPE